MSFIEVILPLPLPGTFTYFVPEEMAPFALPGHRVVVAFGKTKFHTGVVFKVVEEHQAIGQIRAILDVMDDAPVMPPSQFPFLEWMSSYYMCTIGEAMTAALPSGFKLSSESHVGLHPNFNPEITILTEKEEWIIRGLQERELHMGDIKKLTGSDQPVKLIKSLEQRGIIQLFDKIKDKYTPKVEKRIRLTQGFLEEGALDDLLSTIQKKPKQIEVLLAYLKEKPVLEDPSINDSGISKKELIGLGVSESSLSTLLKNHVFELWGEPINRFGFTSNDVGVFPILTPLQELAKNKVLATFEQLPTVLLKGVTGSGKTEIYMSLIQSVVEEGGKILYLLPEIALTTQIITRFRKVFGNSFGVFHSKFSDNERIDIWKKCLNGDFDFVIGVRSAVFLPLEDVSLIIVDEEHEPSYKQQDPAPRYNARDSAIYLANLRHAKVLLGSATPSLESFLNAQTGKYGYVELNERYKDQPMPIYQLVNLADARKRKQLKGNFSNTLLEGINTSIENGKQALLFQNRRGYSPFITCENCGHTPKCPNCAVSLTYHIYHNTLNCHYCGFKESMHTSCESCAQSTLKTVGMGTEMAEEELAILLPSVRIQRMDLDSTRSKNAYQQIIDKFEQKEIDVLIGTQMISKGLDFDDVNLVGIFDADRIIHFPDFRSHERAFQLMTQVGGRAGRKNDRGLVMIQTNDPTQKLLLQIQQNDYEGFYKQEINERIRFKYPPIFRMIVCLIRHKEKQVAYEAADQLSFLIKKRLGERASPPIEPTINRIRNYYRYQLVIRLEKEQMNLGAVKQFLLSSKDTLLALQSFKSVRVHFDVDPL